MILSLFTACGNKDSATTGDAASSDSDVIKIGVFEPLTGENGGGGSQEVGGIKLC